MRARAGQIGGSRALGLGRVALQTPSIPLTLSGMRRPRHRPLRSALLSFSLLSVLALLALAFIPALAQAECTDSSCAQYEVEIPTAGGKDNKGQQSKPGTSEPARASHAPGAKHSSPAGAGNSEEAEESKGGAGPANNGGGNNNGGGGESASPGGGAQTEAGLSGEKPLKTAQGEQTSGSSGGSSPLVPILIAIAVLAAISIGVVIYRQRRQGSGGSGSPVSPKAG